MHLVINFTNLFLIVTTLLTITKSTVCNQASSRVAQPTYKPNQPNRPHQYHPPAFIDYEPEREPRPGDSFAGAKLDAPKTGPVDLSFVRPQSLGSQYLTFPRLYNDPTEPSDLSDDDLVPVTEHLPIPNLASVVTASLSNQWNNTSQIPRQAASIPKKPVATIKSKPVTSTNPRTTLVDNATTTITTQAPLKTSMAITPPSRTQPYVPPLLVYSIRFEIRSFNLSSSMATKQYSDLTESNSALIDQSRNKNPHTKTLIAGLRNAICLDFYYSPQESFIFWIDVSEEKIFRGSISNAIITNVDMIIQGGLSSAEGLAVDWVAKNIYWVESTLDHIEVANMNGTSRRTLIAGQMESPRAISVDPRYGLLFWTDWDKRSPRIERATMSGEDRKTIVNVREVQGGWPNGLTLDYEALKIYWIDANSDSIHVVDYDGNSPRALLRKIKSLGHPFAITLYENNLYWTDWKTNFISTATKFNGSETKAHIQRHQTRLFDIKVFHPTRQPRVEDDFNPCAIDNGKCSHLCLLSINRTRICACPHLMRLTENNMTCESYEKVLLFGKSNEIRAVDITKPLHYIMAPITVPKVFSPRQIEFDARSRSIFWADSSTNEVKRASLAGNNIETIIDVIIDTPNGLSLDWISGNIYVTSASHAMKTGKIFISNLKGEYISILMDHQHGVISPKSIAVHPMLGLIFCIDENEQGEPLIFMASTNGQNKSIIMSRQIDQTLDSPVSLAIDFETNRVYWVNQNISLNSNATIQYYDIAENRTITLYSESESPPEDLIHPGVICTDGDHLIISSRAPGVYLVRASKNNISERSFYETQSLDNIMTLKVYNASSQVGTNACALNNGNCSQLCIPTSATERTCKCTMGYTINQSNETECIGKDLFLIYSSNQGMKGISIEPNSSSDDYYLPPIHRAFRASSIDYIYKDNLIYWVDNEEGSITRINRDTTNHQVIIQGLEQEEYIGIDWIAGNIYWLDPYYDVIEVARLNGSDRYVIVSGDIDKTNGIVVNPLKGYIVWSDIGTIPKIERARLDGTDRKILVGTKVTHLDELAIDFVDDYIYWLDSTLSIIERIKADGTDRRVMYNGQLSAKGSQEHFIAMSIHQQYLYVADASFDGSIIRFDKDNTTDSVTIQHNLGDNIKDITIFAPQMIPGPEANPCVKDNGGCQDLCLFLGERGKRRCICSHGKLRTDGLTCEPHDTFIMYSKLSQIDSLHMLDDESHNNSPYAPIISESKSSIISLTIDYDARRVIYSEMTQNQICSIMFNGTNKKVLVEKQSMVEGIAFENNQLYWTSIQDNSISRLNISSSGTLEKYCNNSKCKLATVEKLVKLGVDDKPRGIALDACTSYVYWTNWNSEASIQRASPINGYKVESIITTNIKVPNGIAIDQKNRKLYWCDARLDKIETCDMDGSNRVVLVNAMPQHPFALVVWKNHIFWTDWLARGVFKADKYTGQQAVQIKKVAQRPMGIAVASSDSYTCPVDSCGRNNGGCPPGSTCISREINESDQSQISCVEHNQNHARILKTAHSRDDLRCSDTDNSLRCREHAIIANQLERFGTVDMLQEINQTFFENQRPAQSVFPTGKIITNTNESTMLSPITSDSRPTMFDATTARSAAPSNGRESPYPSETNRQKFTTIKPTLTNQSTPPSSVASSISQNAITTKAFQQSQKVVDSLPKAILTSASDSNCHDDKQKFKCFKSDSLVCVAIEKRCDGKHDCPNKEDEDHCKIAAQQIYYTTELVPNQRSNWWKSKLTITLIILGTGIAAIALVLKVRGRRRWFMYSYNGFNQSKLFDDDGTNIEISNPMFDEDDSVNLVNCPFSIDLNERTTNFSNPLYERQVLLVNDKNPAT